MSRIPPKPLPERTWDIKDPIYGQLYNLRVSDPGDFDRFLSRFGKVTPTGPNTLGQALLVGPGRFVALWFRNDPDLPKLLRACDPKTVGTVAHECLHAIMYAFERIGSRVDHDNPEPACYYHAWLVSQIVSRLKEADRRPAGKRTKK